MSKSKQYKEARGDIYRSWHREGLKKAPVRINFPQVIINTAWQSAAWCIGLALSISLIIFGINGFLTGAILKSFNSLIKITWIPFTIYSLYWAFRIVDIIIYDRINYPKYLEKHIKRSESVG